ncbi:Ig-like domain-containing protein [Rhizobiaceae bacterium n13]|uniref:Ig-like domain-containing protein n=1 Tax=Ferirhizobium litorale TaxID=2927786 RepID=A0AAE3QDJ7_9HYPH|nr:Ig-like domain-containing protein [Fererhizobium litorale]MDI7861112.1 Ig-like domain-containing protein [Fererhizobium litorale]MDI7921259.1 Ig-like domain-containing protein [Fererhizobium litorale]
MMKNRAGWLALLVLAIATVLMVFFVLPQIAGDEKPIGEAINNAGDEVKEAVTEAGSEAQKATGETADKLAAETRSAVEQVARLSAECHAAITDLQSLFAEGKVPSAEALAGAKSRAELTVKQLAELKLPQGADAATTAAVAKAQETAKTALGILRTLPSDPAAAGSAVATIAPPAASTGTEGQVATAGLRTPTFDVLRVEPDGSTVIAGSAEPGSRLDVVDGEDKVIATAEIGPSGDFAAVLSNPLAPGDHELVLKVTSKDGKSTTSDEVATISVPQTRSGELLAMVSKPGEASRIINAPEGSSAAEADGESNALPTPALPTAATDLASTPPVVGTETGAAAATTGKPEVQVSAVEIENEKIFVAGIAQPGATVRAYADDKLIGEAVTGTDGSFVVDGTMALAVGDHSIRVDMIDTAGKVAVRASVPFNRPEGEQIAVVAQTPQAGSPAAMTPLEDGAFDKLRNEAARAFAILDGLYAEGKVPTDEQLAAARSATQIALKSLAGFRLSTDADAAMKEMVERTGRSATATLEALDKLPADAKSVGDGLSGIKSMIDETLQPALDGRGATSLPLVPSSTTPVSTDGTQPSTTTAAAPAETAPTETATTETTLTTPGEPRTIEQAPLTESRNSVIIRRGDTLWQISRRIYGKGVRYTTIYLANKDQIQDPDLIQPGQIFGIPNEALPDAEERHREHMDHSR